MAEWSSICKENTLRPAVDVWQSAAEDGEKGTDGNEKEQRRGGSDWETRLIEASIAYLLTSCLAG